MIYIHGTVVLILLIGWLGTELLKKAAHGKYLDEHWTAYGTQ